METQIRKNDLTSGIDFTLKNVAWFTRIADDPGWRALYNVVTDEVNPKKFGRYQCLFYKGLFARREKGCNFLCGKFIIVNCSIKTNELMLSNILNRNFRER